MATVTDVGFEVKSNARVAVGWNSPETVDRIEQDSPSLRRSAIRSPEPSPWNCLVVSSVASRRESIASEVSAGGWVANRCARMDAAVRIARQRCAWLVVVELSADGECTALDELAAHVRKVGGLLLIMSAQSGGAADEIRARQLGAWLYLPGEVPAGELASLCGDARQLLDRAG